MNEKKINKEFDKLLELGDIATKAIKNGEGTLTKEEQDKLFKDLESLQPDDDFEEDYIPTKEDMELEKNPSSIYVQMDPYSGKINNVINDGLNSSIYDQDIDKLLAMDQEQIKSEVEVDEKSVKESIETLFPNFELTDFPLFMNVLNRYRKGEKFSYFNTLPKSMRDQIDTIIGGANIGFASQKEARNYVVTGLFDQIINDNYNNRLFIDIDKSIESSYKELYDSTKGDFSNYNNNFRNMLENELPKKAEEIKETEPEKSESLMKISKAFVESYTMTDMFDMYKNTGKLKVKPIMTDKFKRTCDDWCLKYKDHKMIINNVYDLYPSLQKIFSDYDFDDKLYKKFICIFINYTKNMKPDVMEEHVFMYYFIKNILGIVYCNTEDVEETKFCNTVKDNVNKFLNMIKEKDSQNDDNKPNTRKN